MVDILTQILKLFEHLAVIVCNPLHKVYTVQKFSHTVGSKQNLQKRDVSVFVYVLDTLFHGLILQILIHLCRGQIKLRLLRFLIRAFDLRCKRGDLPADRRKLLIQIL